MNGADGWNFTREVTLGRGVETPEQSEVRRRSDSDTDAGTACSSTTEPTAPVAAPWNNDAALQSLADKIRSLWPSHLDSFLEGVLESICLSCHYYAMQIPRDQRVNLLVLSESHSRTQPSIRGRRVQQEFRQLLRGRCCNYEGPGHLNLVHCLSYGEQWLLGGIAATNDDDLQHNRSSTTATNPGTPTFWKMLSILAGEQKRLTKNNLKTAFDHVLVGKTGSSMKGRKKRLRAKIRILDRMRRDRIALVDISPAPIFLAAGKHRVQNATTGTFYNTPKKSLPGKVKVQILRLCWEEFVLPMICEMRPRNIIVLGTTLTQSITLAKLQAATLVHGTILHPTLAHPSARKNQGGGLAYLNEMLRLRRIVEEATGRTQPTKFSFCADGLDDIPSSKVACDGDEDDDDETVEDDLGDFYLPSVVEAAKFNARQGGAASAPSGKDSCSIDCSKMAAGFPWDQQGNNSGTKKRHASEGKISMSRRRSKRLQPVSMRS